MIGIAATPDRRQLAPLVWLDRCRETKRPAARPARVVIADDHTLVRQGIRAILEIVGDCEVVGEARDGREAVALAEQASPDVIIMDLAMPLLNGLEATRQIVQRWPRVRIIALLVDSTVDQVYPLLEAGAAGCLLKDADASELIRAIAEVGRGNTYLSTSVSKTLVLDLVSGGTPRRRRLADDPLSNREREIVQLIGEGLSNQEIAKLLVLSVKTVEAHKAHIMEKLNLKGRAGLLKYAVKRGMVLLDD